MLQSSPSLTNNQQSDNHYHLKLSVYAELACLHPLAAVAIKSENGGKKTRARLLGFYYRDSCYTTTQRGRMGQERRTGKERATSEDGKKSIKTSTAAED